MLLLVRQHARHLAGRTRQPAEPLGHGRLGSAQGCLRHRLDLVGAGEMQLRVAAQRLLRRGQGRRAQHAATQLSRLGVDALHLAQADGVDLVRPQVGGGVRPDQGPIQRLAARQLPDPGAVVRPRVGRDLIGDEGPEAGDGRPCLLGHHRLQLGRERLPVGVAPAGVRALGQRRQQRPLGVGPRQHVVQLLDHPRDRGADGAASLRQAAAHAGLHLRQGRRDRSPAGQHVAAVGLDRAAAGRTARRGLRPAGPRWRPRCRRAHRRAAAPAWRRSTAATRPG